jgi:hypothetical protein
MAGSPISFVARTVVHAKIKLGRRALRWRRSAGHMTARNSRTHRWGFLEPLRRAGRLTEKRCTTASRFGGFFFEPLLTPRRQIATGGLRDPDLKPTPTKQRFKLGGVARLAARAGFRPISPRRGAMKIPSGRRKQQPGKIGSARQSNA